MSTSEHPYLTTREVADLLRLKERKIYDLVAEGRIPHVKVTGKLLFPRDLVEAWLARNLECEIGAESLKEPPPIVAGSHDPLLDWALANSKCGLAQAYGGSLNGLHRLARGEALAAGTHLVESYGENGELSWNKGFIARTLPGRPVVAVRWARRRQGLIVAPGNPLDLKTAADLKRAKFIGRQRESGAFVLLQLLTDQAGLSLSDMKLVDEPAHTESEVSAAVAKARADAGLAIEAVARQYRLDFVPLVTEYYDLVIWRRAYFDAPVQALLSFARSPAFRKRAKELGGYDVTDIGKVTYNGP